MIEYIIGKIDTLTPATVTIETPGGVAYLFNISLNTFSALEGKEHCRLLVHESIREDAWVLYGFNDNAERELFRLLIGVSGVGANTARMILSALTAAELSTVIAAGEAGPLKNIKGIGTKTAQRIIVDLRDKIKSPDDTLLSQVPGAAAVDPQVHDEALAALLMLGFNRQQSLKALEKIFKTNQSIKVEDAIKQALAMM